MAKRPKAQDSTQAPSPEAIRDAVIEATMDLAARSGWRNLTMAEVAADASLPLSQVLIPFPTKYAVVNAFQDRIDARMLAAADRYGQDNGETDDIRDRLFDLLMERFDALAPYRAAMAEIAKDSIGDPGALCFIPRMGRTMARVLEATGLKASGPFGLLQAKGLALVYADAFRIWVRDDSPDQARTMATLDRGLRRAEKTVRLLRRIRPFQPNPKPTPEAGPEAATADTAPAA